MRLYTSVKMPKSIKKSCTTQTSISSYFGGLSSSVPDRNAQSGIIGNNVEPFAGQKPVRKQKHSPNNNGGSLWKRAKLAHNGQEKEDMNCEVISWRVDEIRVPSSRGAGSLSSSTLERLKGFICPSEPQGRGPPGPGDAGGRPGDVGRRPGDVGDGSAHGGNGPGDVGGREAVTHKEMTGDKERQKSEEEEKEEEERWSPEPSTKKQALSLIQFAKPGEGGRRRRRGGGGGGGVMKSPPGVGGEASETSAPCRISKSGYTPLEQQYLQIKEQHKDALLAVECGYKYRFFGEDAEKAAKQLNIFCHLDHNFMTCSIPTHRLFVHVRRLVSQGYKVGVVKQTETSAIKASGANKNTLFTRQLSALYTKSTLVGEDVNPVYSLVDVEEGECDVVTDPPESYLLCFSETWDKQSKQLIIGLVAVQPSTGDVLLDSFVDDSTRCELEGRVLKVNPVEILVPSDLSDSSHRLLQSIVTASVQAGDGVRIEKRDSAQFDFASAMNTVTEFFCHTQDSGSKPLSGIASLESPVVCCLGPLIHYLTEFNLQRVLLHHSSFRRLSCESDGMVLSATTLRNLEVLNNQTDGGVKGSLLWVLDHTHTSFGRRLMRKWVSQPLKDTQSICERQGAVCEILESDSVTLPSVRALLFRLPDLERGVCSIYHKKCSTQEFYLISSSLCRLGVELQALLLSIQSQLSSALLRGLLLDTPELLAPAHNFLKVLNEKAAKSGDKRELFCDLSGFPVLQGRRAEIQSVLTEIQDHRREVRYTLRTPTLDYVSVSGQEFLIEVKNSMASVVPSDWVKISSTKAVSRYQSPYLIERCRSLSQLREQLLIDSQKEWTNFLHQFGEYYHTMKKAVGNLATMDCLFSLADVAKQRNYCRPVLCEGDRQIVIRDGRHPVIDLLVGEHTQYVPNNTDLQGDGRRTMIITGPNMGGKSSYIRQVALVSIMAQVGSYVPATEARLGILDGIYTRMGASDSIYKGRSTFMEELTEASEIVARATERSLVILDELGRGTSTHDGIAIAYATLEYFIRDVKSLTLFVTHYPPLCELERVYPLHVGNFHMAFLLNEPDIATDDGEVQPEFITFLYQLTEGAAGQSYGLNVARLAEIPEAVLHVAARKAQELENTIDARRKGKRLLSELWRIDDRKALLDWVQLNS
ncbi:DNA mismatch repair protein Msh3 isoform X1 [Coregonus clupeaformis]|uniref:DNA mismatch repair protein Msh3 isoform X1 n=1 Tax=Coregonus clupeaformis TaxID=59861 RepID=UPI001E1C995C|nr:DNA mismatch repair protein Msh3 isoform X1 [Coregonus clupeaformis]